MQRVGVKQSDENLNNEAKPLLGRAVSTTKQFLKRLNVLVPNIIAFDRFNVSLNALGASSAGSTPVKAFPTLYPSANRISTLAGLPLVAAQLGLSTAADRGWGKAEKVRQVTSAMNYIFNNFCFGLEFYIAGYLAADQILNHIGDKKVDVSNAQYFTQFVLVTALFSILHGTLELTKSKWQHANGWFAKLCKGTNQVAGALNKASNSNGVTLLALSALNITEVGNMNPYDRLGIFGEIFMVGTILQVLSNYGPAWEINVNRLVNAASAVTYVSSIFTTPNNQEFSRNELAFIATFFGAILLLATLSAKLLPPVERNQTLEPINESQPRRSTP